MRSDTKPVLIHEAVELVRSHRPDLRTETVMLDHALGRILAEPVEARVTLPSADVSAMDGYAVRFEDAKTEGAKLRLIGHAPAGRPFTERVGPGEAVRIFTGGVVPAGADHILIQEMAKAQGDHVCVSEAQTQRRHIRKAGHDFRAGQVILQPGKYLEPSDLGMIAAANISEVRVARALRVAILTTGNELRAPGSDLKVGDVINSNATALAALCRFWGAEPDVFAPTKDTVESVLHSAERASSHDIIVFVGGASVGDFDVVKPAMDKLGMAPIFSKIAVRPGKPTWFGMWEQKPILGLPGNPVAAYVGANLLLSCLLGKCDQIPFQSAQTVADLDGNGALESFKLALSFVERGQTKVRQLSHQDTSLTRSLVAANCLLYRPTDAPARNAGDEVSIVPLA